MENPNKQHEQFGFGSDRIFAHQDYTVVKAKTIKLESKDDNRTGAADFNFKDTPLDIKVGDLIALQGTMGNGYYTMIRVNGQRYSVRTSELKGVEVEVK